jgi:M6 family metalloprotease-like protein
MKKQYILLTFGALAITLIAFIFVSRFKTNAVTNLGTVIASKLQNASKAPSRITATKEITLRGQLEILHADDLKNKKTWNEYWIKGEGGNKVNVTGEKLDSLNLVSGNTISVVGVYSGNELKTSVEKITVTNSSSVARVGKTPTSKDGKRQYKAAIILFNFSDNPTQTYSPAYAKQVMYGNTPNLSVNNFYQDVSSGSFSIVGKVDPAGDVYGWYTLPTTQANCLTFYASSWKMLADQAAAADGFIESNYDGIFYNFPTGSVNCAWSGVASEQPVPNTATPEIPFVFINGDWTPVYIHELGHILGLRHANTIACIDENGDPVQLSTHCISYEYGDPYDTMGAVDGLYFNSRNKDYLGFFPARNMATVTTSGTYILKSGNAPISQNQIAATGSYAIRIPLGTSDGGENQMYYYLESRDPQKWDTSIPLLAQTGVSIRFAVNDTVPYINNNKNTQAGDSRSYLIDTHLATATFDDAPLQIGETYIDQYRNLKITYMGQTSAGKSIKIEFMRGAINCTMLAPSIAITPSFQTGTVNTTINYQYAITDNDTGTNCPARILDTLVTTYPSYPARFDRARVAIRPNTPALGQIAVTTPIQQINATVEIFNTAIHDMYGVGGTSFSLSVPSSTVPCANRPTTTFSPAVVSGTAGQSKQITITLLNNNSSTCGNANFSVAVDNMYAASGWTVSPMANINLASGGQLAQTFSIVSPTSATPGGHLFRVLVNDVTNSINYGNVATLQYIVQ